MADTPAVNVILCPSSVSYDYTCGAAATRYLLEVEQKRLMGQKADTDSLVYTPPRGTDPASGRPTGIEVEVGPRGTVTTFCVVNIPFAGQAVECPYVQAHILLDGADIPIFHLLQEVDAADVHPGMRVEPVWVADDEMGPTMESIAHFRPADEPDVDLDELRRDNHI